ncbi:hypothetical protein [uncultured Roseobacter sp.]|uniref:hypothetical protein n=1 Tax=uncultured Roseobacter sp. TaxID=114847 RepID=UPI0026165170|nr:hypothetical protein [uncultured Roseobacter sp.]
MNTYLRFTGSLFHSAEFEQKVAHGIVFAVDQSQKLSNPVGASSLCKNAKQQRADP